MDFQYVIVIQTQRFSSPILLESPWRVKDLREISLRVRTVFYVTNHRLDSDPDARNRNFHIFSLSQEKRILLVKSNPRANGIFGDSIKG